MTGFHILAAALLAVPQERINIPPAELPAALGDLVRKLVPAGAVTEVTRRVKGDEEQYGVRIFVAGRIAEAEFVLEPGAPPEGEIEEPVGEADLPKAVADAFRKALPDVPLARGLRVTAIDEERPDGHVTYVWKLKDPKRTVEIAGDGATAKVRRRISEAELPAPVRAAIARDHADARIRRVEQVVVDAATTYEIDVEGGHDLVATADGRLSVED